MATLTYGMNCSLDGFVDHDRFGPGAEIFAHFIEQTRGLTGSLYGRGLYEVMRYWDEEQSDWGGAERDFAEAWRRQPKWVVSQSLERVGPNATLVRPGELTDLAGDLRGSREGRIDVGGTKLAATLTALALIDEYQLYVHPVVLGHGTPFFAATPPPLRLLASDAMPENVVRLTYALKDPGASPTELVPGGRR